MIIALTAILIGSPVRRHQAERNQPAQSMFDHSSSGIYSRREYDAGEVMSMHMVQMPVMAHHVVADMRGARSMAFTTLMFT